MPESMVMSENVFTTRGRGLATARVVLVVADQRVERVSAAAHLRQSGFDVVEAADGDEARRVLESVSVDIVVADLATSSPTTGPTSGLTFLRWLREHHPAVKIILTSATEMNVATMGGYDIFLSKPYRPIDLDYCLQKVLTDANGPDQGLTADPEPGRAPAVDASAKKRMSWRSTVDPITAAGRRAFLQACDRAREPRVIAGAGVAVAVIAGSAIALFGPTVSSTVVAPPSPSAASSPSASIASIPPVAEPAPPSGPATVAAATASAQPAEDAQSQAPLRRDEVREVQARLRSFGFNPGRVDGIPGPMSVEAVMRYQKERGQPQTGKIDGELLEQLRQDPAPQVAEAAPRPAARRSDPFEAVRAAGDRLSRWLGSLAR